MQLGFGPRVEIPHTAVRHRGLIYVPVVTWILMVASIALVLAFRTRGALASAYAVAVAATMVITPILLFVVCRKRRGWSAVAI